MKNIELKNIIEEVFKKEKKNKFTFLTGAGISSDSGIPTYRGSDGIWVKGTKFHKPEKFGTFEYFHKNPEEVWQYTLFRKRMLENAEPNQSHEIIADIENELKDRFQLITQNVDNLHRRAGNERLFEIHGNYREIKCSGACSEIRPMPTELKSKELTEGITQKEIDALKCPNCGAWMRANILWFDEYYDEKTNKVDSSLRVAKNTGVLFVVGTSGATNLPMRIAETTIQYGGYVVDINLEDNSFSNYLSTKKNKLILRGKSIDFLPEIKHQIKNCVEQRV
ncbi:SIR2 family NAD-dependent protein deacylase [Psychroserpens mesophilus]|uniref:SIR2 family NAD-dependent protein deacylase n=1 Tax=Psychroserpens mesophilus TaxID=325473 RepID=UPI003D655245